jgi:hypothetical protein
VKRDAILKQCEDWVNEAKTPLTALFGTTNNMQASADQVKQALETLKPL